MEIITPEFKNGKSNLSIKKTKCYVPDINARNHNQKCNKTNCNRN